MLKKTTYPFHTTASWSILSHDVYEYMNNPGSEIVYLQAGIHGNEILWIPVLYELIDYISQYQPKINIIIVPIANPSSLDSQIMWVQSWYNNIHTNEQNCWNYNRLWTGIAEPLEDAIVQSLLSYSKNADVVIDLHCAAYETSPHIYTNINLVEEAKSFWIQTILTRDVPGKAFEDVCFSFGKKAFTLELGPSRSTNDVYISRWFQYLKNYLFWSDSVVSDYLVYSDSTYCSIYTTHWWILVWHINVGDQIPKWQHIATVYTKEGKEKLYAPYTGMFLTKKPIHAPHQNQQIGKMLCID